MTKSVLEVLTTARTDVLASPANWAQGWFALDANGDWSTSDAPDATCFCAWGAIYRAADTNEDEQGPPSERAGEILSEAVVELFPDRIADRNAPIVPHFNDHEDTTYEDVLKVFDRAIELAGAR